MRLTSAQIERTLRQFQAEPIPEDHPVVPQLNRLFGEHTFFLATNGLNIVEPAEPLQSGIESARVVNLASWSGGNQASLKPHEPEPTDVVVALGIQHRSGNGRKHD
jgi:hypothetical protein